MLLKFFLIILYISSLTPIIGQGVLHSNPVSLALSSCDVTLSNEWSVQGNPAGNGSAKSTEFALLVENRYSLKELTTRGFSCIVPTKFGIINAAPFQFGFSDLNISRYTLGYSRFFGTKVLAGFQLNYWSVYISGSGYFNTLISDFGLIYSVLPQLTIGVHLFNPEQSSIEYQYYDYEIPGQISYGIGWKFMKSSTYYIEFEKEYDSSPNISNAVQSELYKGFIGRIGYSYSRNEISSGVGIIIRSFDINLGFLYHQPLGFISSISLAYNINK
ncbi:MAG: hypothetical protein JW717_09725 [Marinilabiliaceae bacterium]|nr:hypothetical protein [Marinilabiliaceae bacterium]